MTEREDPTETSAGEVGGREYVTDERVEQLFKLADEILRAPSRFEKSFIVNELGQAVAELVSATERARAELAELRERIGEEPRPFLSAAIRDVTPEIMKWFKEEWAKVVADWDGTVVVVEPAKVQRVEWEVHYGDGTLSGAVLLDDDDARKLARRTADRNPTVVYRTIGDWQEVPDGR